MTEITSARLKWFTIFESVIMRVALCGVQFKFNFRIKRYNYFQEKGRKWKEFRVVKHKNPRENPRRRLGNHKSNLVFYARITLRVLCSPAWDFFFRKKNISQNLLLEAERNFRTCEPIKLSQTFMDFFNDH